MNAAGALGTPTGQEAPMLSTTAPATRSLVLDGDGILAITEGLVHYLTLCCRASAKGSADSPTGVCCRSCYRPVPSELGAGWRADDKGAWASWETSFKARLAVLNAANFDSPIVASMIVAVREQAAA